MKAWFGLVLGPNVSTARFKFRLGSFIRVYKPYAHSTLQTRTSNPNRLPKSSKLMAIKRDTSARNPSSTAASRRAIATVPALVFPSDEHLDLFDDEDHLIMDSLARDIEDLVFLSISEETGDGELPSVLRLTADILEAKQLFGNAEGIERTVSVTAEVLESKKLCGKAKEGLGHTDSVSDEVDFHDFGEDIYAVAAEFKRADSHEGAKDAEDFADGDNADASEFFDCYEGIGIAMKGELVVMKREGC